jgi:hypothetical protein
MVSKARSSPIVPGASLSNRIEEFIDSFRRLSRASTLKELSKQFGCILRTNTSSSSVHVFYKASRTVPWEAIVDGGEPDAARILKIPAGKAIRVSLSGKEKRIALVQKLSDKSFIGAVLCRGTSAPGYSPDDTLSARLLMSLF